MHRKLDSGEDSKNAKPRRRHRLALAAFAVTRHMMGFAPSSEHYLKVAEDTASCGGELRQLSVEGCEVRNHYCFPVAVIVLEFKKTDLFIITFTANPEWKEITENLLENQTAYDRPDLVARVFELKKKALIADLHNRGVLSSIRHNANLVRCEKGFAE